MIKLVVACVVVFVLLAIAGVHVYWAFGGHVGASQAVPHVGSKPTFTPGKWGTLAVALLLTLAAIGVGATARAFGSGTLAQLARWPTGFVAVVFFARAIGEFHYVGFFKRVNGTPFAHLDTTVYSPLCLALALAIAYVIIAE